jgi:adenylate cyclase class IV
MNERDDKLESDHTQIKRMCEKLRDSALRLHSQAIDVGSAITVKEFTTRRYENLVAVYTKKYLDKGVKSKAEAEIQARNDPEYSQQFERLFEEAKVANQTISIYKTEVTVNDSARSLLSASKGVRNDLMG